MTAGRGAEEAFLWSNTSRGRPPLLLFPLPSSPRPTSIRKSIFGEKEWYFFTHRYRKYPNRAPPNSAAASGYWKATGTDKPVLTSSGMQKVGVKKALVFYGGWPPKGVKTNGIMHEYRLADGGHSNPNSDVATPSLRFDEWVLCRIYKKKNQRQSDDSLDDVTSLPPNMDGHNSINLQKTTAALEGEEIFFYAFLSDDGSSLWQLAPSSGMPQNSATGAMFSPPSQRTLPSPYWNEGLRHDANSSSNGGGSWNAALLSQLPNVAAGGGYGGGPVVMVVQLVEGTAVVLVEAMAMARGQMKNSSCQSSLTRKKGRSEAR
ncbi:hypothetical protein EJ110_NYTH20982 [Nymphaea thermarum]|nr:hypothetical protein EJ110_NYTH20982 [Nymphaea thermarum]